MYRDLYEHIKHYGSHMIEGLVIFNEKELDDIFEENRESTIPDILQLLRKENGDYVVRDNGTFIEIYINHENYTGDLSEHELVVFEEYPDTDWGLILAGHYECDDMFYYLNLNHSHVLTREFTEVYMKYGGENCGEIYSTRECM